MQILAKYLSVGFVPEDLAALTQRQAWLLSLQQVTQGVVSCTISVDVHDH
jgi:hypothetical protein